MQLFPDWLVELDKSILHWVGLHAFNPNIAHWMRLAASPESTLMAAIALATVLIVERRIKGAVILLNVIVAVIMTDFVSSSIIKHSVNRERPCVQEVQSSFAIGCGGASPSFPSSHAANSMAVAATAISYSGIYGLLLTAASILVGFTRVYVGMHFPSDVIFGWLVGLTIAALLARGLRYVFRRIGFNVNL